MPADIQLSGMEVSLVNAMSRETILRQYLDTLKGQYSHILIDCQPSLGMLTVNALAAADRIIIPVQAEYLPAKGLEQLLSTVSKKTKRQINPKRQIDGILLTMVDNRTNFAKEISALLRDTYGSKIKVFGISFIFIFILYKIDSKQYKMSPKNNSKFVGKLLHISLPIAFTSYVRSGLSTLQQLLIPFRLEKSGISCETALSQYGQVSGMVMPIIMFPSIFILSFCNLLIPEFSEYNVQNKMVQINYNITKIIKYTLYFSTCIFGIFLCFSKELCTIIYNMPELSTYLVVLSPTIILIYLDKVVDSILKGLDKQVRVMGINILDLFSCLGFIYFLLPVVGINGYLFVILFSETLNFTLSLRILIKETHFKFDITNIIKPAFSLICSILLIFIFKGFFDLHIVNLIILVCMFIVFYLLILKFLEKRIL